MLTEEEKKFFVTMKIKQFINFTLCGYVQLLQFLLNISKIKQHRFREFNELKRQNYLMYCIAIKFSSLMMS